MHFVSSAPSIPTQIPSRLGPGELGGGLVNVAEPFQNFQDAMAGAVGLRASIEDLLAWGVAHLPGSDAGDEVLREAVEMATQVQREHGFPFFSSGIRDQELTTQRVSSTFFCAPCSKVGSPEMDGKKTKMALSFISDLRRCFNQASFFPQKRFHTDEEVDLGLTWVWERQGESTFASKNGQV